MTHSKRQKLLNQLDSYKAHRNQLNKERYIAWQNNTPPGELKKLKSELRKVRQQIEDVKTELYGTQVTLNL